MQSLGWQKILQRISPSKYNLRAQNIISSMEREIPCGNFSTACKHVASPKDEQVVWLRSQDLNQGWFLKEGDGTRWPHCVEQKTFQEQITRI